MLKDYRLLRDGQEQSETYRDYIFSKQVDEFDSLLMGDKKKVQTLLDNLVNTALRPELAPSKLEVSVGYVLKDQTLVLKALIHGQQRMGMDQNTIELLMK